MDKDAFYRLIQDSDKYTQVNSLENLQGCFGCIVRIRRRMPGQQTKYYQGGVLTTVDADNGFFTFKSLINNKTYRMNAPHCTFYVLWKPDDELQQWEDLHKKLFKVELV